MITGIRDSCISFLSAQPGVEPARLSQFLAIVRRKRNPAVFCHPVSRAQPDAPEKLRVFISYSRRDMAFVDRLVDALKARGFEVQIDRQDLPKLEDWERELLHLIRQCDTVVFVVSPNSLASTVVGWEVEQVRLCGKRLAPVVIGTVDGLTVPPDISRINYIFFSDDAQFDQRVDDLAHALNSNVAWLREHTRLGELARRWIERGKPNDGLLRGQEADDAAAWASRHPREAPPITEAQQQFLAASRTMLARQARRRRQAQAVLGLVFVAAATYAGWVNQSYLRLRLSGAAETLRPKVLTVAAERTLKPKDSFRECSACPEMVVVPTGEFLMGSPESETGRKDTEAPQHKVTIARAFAASRFEVTFDEWDACSTLGGCTYRPSDESWGRGTRPVINVSWHDAQQYSKWLSLKTGKLYRLLSEAEWEYAARAGSEQAYTWGDQIGTESAHCKGCGSHWDNTQTAPVGSFAANAFGLYDMHGNVWEWVEDCWHDTYQDAPTDALAWVTGCTDETRHVVRSGGWDDIAEDLRAAARYPGPTDIRRSINGIRLGRTLSQ
jgi:formylglycine-generating enzyme required for sulfatase activity